MIDIPLLLENAEKYAKSKSINLLSQDCLGFGTDGVVWQTDRQTVVKIIERPHVYERERDCYRRFKERGVIEIAGFAVPELIDCDDDLRVIEMTFVDPPRVPDFGKVSIDCLPPYHDDKRVLANARAKWIADFGEDWSSVAMLLHVLWEDFGIYYADPSTNNVLKRHRGPDDPLDDSVSPEWDMEIYADPDQE